MVKKILYGAVGVMIGGVVFVLCLINIPQDNMGEISTVVNSTTELPTNYQAISPVLFDSYRITDSDITQYVDDDIVNYGVKNPMFIETVEIVEKTPDETPAGENEESTNTSTNEDALIDTDDKETVLESDANSGTTSNTPTGDSNANILNSSFMSGYALGFDLGSDDQSINISDSRLINTEDITAAIIKSSSFPLETGKYSVSSGFGERAFVDVTPDGKSADEPKTEFHSGVDLWSSTIDGAKIKSIVAGTVETIVPVDAKNSGAGNYVIVNHGTFKTLYGHMSKFAENLKVGDKVDAGTLIGYVGTTGRSTGPHLHIEILVGTYCIDPEPFINKILNK